ncbi:hypothetical protein LZC95_36765 [Pendulispora brunnea]|uniref:Uncharacterized protein n=1 Tax=Pendulispora brunnea TaxID=2905690 RepID=A0ABZ2JZS1_9BACT
MKPSTRPARLARSILPFLPVASLACGGATPEPAPPKPVEKPVEVAPPPDVSAVPAPTTLLAFGRVQKPADVLQIVGGWTGTPLPPDVVTELVANAAVSKAADLGRPVDFAVATDPKKASSGPGFALSVALRPLEESKPVLEKSFTLKPAQAGIIRLEPKEANEEEDRRECAIFPSADAPFRLVCGTSGTALDLLGPYLSRTSPRAKYASDVHVEVTPEPFRPMLTQGRSLIPSIMGQVLGIRKTDNPASELEHAALGDFVDFAIDLDRLELDGKLAEPGADATLTASFKGHESLTTRLAVSHPERAGAAPPAFWRMPASSDVALFHGAIDEKDVAHARDLTLDAIAKQLAKSSVAEADKKLLKDAVSHTTALFLAPGVYAKGIDVEGEQKAVAAAKANREDAKAGKKGAKDQNEMRRAVGEQLAGWSLFSVEEPIAKVSGVVKELGAALARPGIVKWLKEENHGLAAPTLKATASPRNATLPKGTVHYELTVVHEPPESLDLGKKPADAKKPGAKEAKAKVQGRVVKMHIFLAPDANRTVMGFGVDDVLAAKMLAGVFASGPTLETREGLDELKRAKTNAGGFITTRGFVTDSPLAYVSDKKLPDRDPLRPLQNAPAHGGAVIPFTWLAQPGKDANGGSFVATVKLPKAAVQDIVATVTQAGR